MRFASIGSGSEGNGLVVEAGSTRILIDCGFGVRDAAARLARIGVAPSSLSAIFVTHEHSDHVGGVPAFAARYGIPVWLTFGTLTVVGDRFAGMEHIYGFDSSDAIVVGDLQVRPFPVPHDAREPVQFVVTDGAFRLGVLTDLGDVHAVCRAESDRLRRAGARVQPRSRFAGRQRLPGLAEAAHRGALRPSAQRSFGGIAGGARHEPAAAHPGRPSFEAEQYAGHGACRAGGRSRLRPDWIGIADQADGFAWRGLA